MTTTSQQKQMFYSEGHKVVKEMLLDYINRRSKERFNMIEDLRKSGEINSRWNEVSLFDEITDKQIRILGSMK